MTDIIVMIGPPYSGKGTYSRRMTEMLDKPCFSVGEWVKENLKNGNLISDNYTQEDFDAGKLVPEEVIIPAVLQRVSELNNSCILDGFPRTKKQAEAFVEKFKDKYTIIDLTVDTSVLLERAANRRVCSACGKIYALNNPNMLPLEGNLCTCGSLIVERTDDSYETAINRLKNFHNSHSQIIEVLLKHTDKGINLANSQSNNVEMITNVLLSNLDIVDKHGCKLIIDIYEG